MIAADASVMPNSSPLLIIRSTHTCTHAHGLFSRGVIHRRLPVLQIENLPGLGENLKNIKQFSGYLEVNPGRFIHYW